MHDFPAHHRRALAQRLREGAVTFKNGSVVTPEGECYRVSWPGGKSEFVNEFAHDGLARAYGLALDGPTLPPVPRRRPKKQPSGDGSRFGDVPF